MNGLERTHDHIQELIMVTSNIITLCFTIFLFQAMSLLYPKLIDMFYFGGPKHTNPNCPIELRPSLNPSSGIQSYDDSNPLCTKPSYYNFPFFLNKLGPRSSEWSINAHEARPGHHIQVTESINTNICFVVGRKFPETKLSTMTNGGDPLVSFKNEGRREGRQAGGQEIQGKKRGREGRECF